jgi:pyruvate kinase
MDFYWSKKTKIVATIGPVSESYDTMCRMVRSGLNVVRLNFSHGTHDEHSRRISAARKVSSELEVPLAVLQDLAGPKIRLGELSPERFVLKTGAKFILTAEQLVGNDQCASVNYSRLPQEVGKNIFLNDGKVKLSVERVDGGKIVCVVSSGGEIKSKCGVNVPDGCLTISSLTEKDRKDVELGIKSDVDFMALSFVRKAADILELREILNKAKADIKIIAKVETPEAVENIDSIIEAADGIMVARGDLAIEVSAERVPILQKLIVHKCNLAGKPVIVATQMMESMIRSPVPTRAEVNDVANAILDGADAVMLSEETTLGSHPVETVQMMSKIALHTEQHFPYEETLKRHHLAEKDVTSSVGFAVVNAAHDVRAKAIIALSVSGFTARMIARCRPQRPVLVVTPNRKTYNRLALKFNCYPVLAGDFVDVNETLDRAKSVAREKKFAGVGDKVVICAGYPYARQGSTNMLLVETIA